VSKKAFEKIEAGLKEILSGKTLRGYRLKDGKIEKISGYGLNASAKIKQKKSKKQKPIRRTP